MSAAASPAEGALDAPPVAVVLDDLASGAAPLAWGSALARGLRRELHAVYVEDTSALAAAALPITQTLAHGTAVWTPYGVADMLRAQRAQLARLADTLQRAAAQHHIRSSLQVVRDTLHHAALAIDDRSDLVLVSGTTLSLQGERTLACRTVLVWAEDGERGLRMNALAARCAESLGAARYTLHGATDLTAALRTIGDLLVMPRWRASPALLAQARGPVLLVGSKD